MNDGRPGEDYSLCCSKSDKGPYTWPLRLSPLFDTLYAYKAHEDKLNDDVCGLPSGGGCRRGLDFILLTCCFFSLYLINPTHTQIVSLTELMAGVKAPVRNVQLFQLTCWPMGHKVRTAREYLGGGRQAQGMDGGISVFNEIFSG